MDPTHKYYIHNNKRKMDNRKVKRESVCCQVLFNKPLRVSEHKYIYGFRVKVDERNKKNFSEKVLLEYIIEGVFGKCLFQEIHDGTFEGEDENIWIDREGNEYKGYGVQTRLYCYDASIENLMNYRCDLVYTHCDMKEGKNYWISDPVEYFDEKAKMDEDDHKLGRNQWLENYNRILARRKVLSSITIDRRENLDYDIQEIIREEWSDVKR